MKELQLIAILTFFLSITQVAHLNPIARSLMGYNDTDLAFKRDFIVNMTRDAWNAYTQFAWGNDTVYPVSKGAENPDNLGETIFASAPTLYIMGLKDEYERAKDWIQQKFNVSKANRAVKRNDLIVNNMASLLSLYSLSGDELFLNKSKEIAQFIKRTYQTKTGLPFNFLNYDSLRDSSLIALENIGAQQPENIFLSDLTSDSELKSLNAQTKKFVKNIQKPKGLLLRHLSFREGIWVRPLTASLGSQQAILTNLLNAYIQSNGQDKESLEIFNSAVDAAEKNGLIEDFSNSTQLFRPFYAREYNTETDKYSAEMHSSSCYLGALLSRAANATKQFAAKNQTLNMQESINQRAERYTEMALGITETCHQAANLTKTGILPKTFAANDSTIVIDPLGITNPALASSYFVLWLATQLEQYREYAWQLTQAIWFHSRTESGGYADVVNVNQVPATDKIDYQVPNLLSGTLKFLYLIFAQDSVYPLDQWVFNPVGHQLPVCGQNAVYPTEKCNQL